MSGKEFVIVNTDESEIQVGFPLDGFCYGGGMAQVIRTSLNENWAQLPDIPVQQDMLRATLAPYSVTTFIVEHVTLN